jgi:hypothetical protein
MQHIKDLPAKQLMEGITGHYAHGSNMSFGYINIKAGTNMPVHQHVHDHLYYRRTAGYAHRWTKTFPYCRNVLCTPFQFTTWCICGNRLYNHRCI